MLRDKSLIPLSHQHQHALALCVRIERAPAEKLPACQAEIEQSWQSEISWHFAAEEQALFPVARRYPEMAALVEELLREHEQLRAAVQCARERRMGEHEIRQFAADLASHIRKEERQLFETCQAYMSADQLQRIGTELEKALAAAPGESCSLPPRTS